MHSSEREGRRATETGWRRKQDDGDDDEKVQDKRRIKCMLQVIDMSTGREYRTYIFSFSLIQRDVVLRSVCVWESGSGKGGADRHFLSCSESCLM